MRVIIAGGRDCPQALLKVDKAVIASGFNITEVVCGLARGVDVAGNEWAEENFISVRYFPPDWNKFGKAAGMIRNKQMAENADALIAIWDGKSRGTKGMIEIAKKLGLKVYIHHY